MITRIQNFFLKHNKWLFGSLLVVIIVTFVLTIGPQSIFDGSGGPARQKLEFFGFDLASPGDQQVMMRRAELSMALNPDLRIPRDQLGDYAYLRLAGLGMADRLGIPVPSRDHAGFRDFIHSIRIFHDPETEEFSAEIYNQILQALESGGFFTREMLGIVLREDFRIAQVRRALGGPDFSLPFEIRQDFIDQQAEYDFVLAHYPEQQFQPEIEISDADVEQFFAENPNRYLIPEQITVSLIVFTADRFLEQTEMPTEAAITNHFAQNQQRFQEAANAALPEDAEPVEVTLADVQDEVIAELRMAAATRIAEQTGSAFALRLWNGRIPRQSPEFDQLVASMNGSKTTLDPFSRENPPRNPQAPRELLESMWIYTTSAMRYFSDSARIPNGAVVGILEGLSPERMPPLDEVRDRVANDFRNTEKRRLFTERGRELHAIFLENPADFIATAESLGLQIDDIPPFVGMELPFTLRFGGLWEQIQFLNQGDISPMILQAGRGTFAYLRSKVEPEIDESDEDFITFANQRRQMFAEAMGWGRLREITDTSLAQVFGPGVLD